VNAKVGTRYLKLNGSGESPLTRPLCFGDVFAGQVSPRDLAMAIASRTVDALVESEMLERTSAQELLLRYNYNLNEPQPAGQSILHFLFPDEYKLALAVRRLNSQVQLHVWEMAHRIGPPRSFYAAHPDFIETCKLCGAVVLDAATPATLTTGTINPLAADFLRGWIQSTLEKDPACPRFLFNVVIPPQHWPAVVRAHFRTDHGI